MYDRYVAQVNKVGTSQEKMKIAVVGGGQLAQMMIEATTNLKDITIATMDSSDDTPASKVGKHHYVGNFKNDPDGKAFSAYLQSVSADVLTFEIEHIDTVGLEQALIGQNIKVQPSIQTMRLIQDKYAQKVHLRSKGAPMSEFKPVNSKADLNGQKFPAMLKSMIGAYDGKGNFVLKGAEDIDEGLKVLGSGLYVEEWVPYVKELAVMVVKSVNGEVQCYPVVETIQKDSICHMVIAPAHISKSAAQQAKEIAMQAVNSFDGAGIFGVELFMLADGTVLFNELAPRPHNSGHYTIEACYTSQFENHIRAVTGMPLGSCEMKVQHAVMVNIIGEEATPQLLDKITECKRATLHWYGKAEVRKGRKMAHFTIVGSNYSSIRKALQKLDIKLPKSPEVAVIMGSDSDLYVMQAAVDVLKQFGVSCLTTIVSAHRTPERLMSFSQNAASMGIKVIIAGAGGAAHLPGMVASLTTLPVIGVPVALKHLDGVDSLYSIVQMPRGVPCATVAINNATNAGLLAVRMLSCYQPKLQVKMAEYQEDMKKTVLEKALALEQKDLKE